MVKFEVEKVSRKGNSLIDTFDLPADTTVDALTELLQKKSMLAGAWCCAQNNMLHE